ncbi:hypothetical protein B4064_2883 [Caldibacillus thermoamylovorans]|nr:hypothetical protein B4065_2880 [Caldibacillus thermoamylovorans]KIO64268.1 hypothetical protein B4064_2883 [Caldibacillus thermoamylovorans]
MKGKNCFNSKVKSSGSTTHDFSRLKITAWHRESQATSKFMEKNLTGTRPDDIKKIHGNRPHGFT